jgi:hypothetical protein
MSIRYIGFSPRPPVIRADEIGSLFESLHRTGVILKLSAGYRENVSKPVSNDIH